MKIGEFCRSIQAFANFCDSSDLLEQVVTYSSFAITDSIKGVLYTDDYNQIYSLLDQQSGYNIRLSDHSFWQFSMYEQNKGFKLRYAFYPVCPLTLIGEYSEFPFQIPIRYDFDLLQYNTPFHPAGHLHFSNYSDFRVPVSRVLTPFSFGLYVLSLFGVRKQLDVDLMPITAAVWRECKPIELDYWTRGDQEIPHIGCL